MRRLVKHTLSHLVWCDTGQWLLRVDRLLTVIVQVLMLLLLLKLMLMLIYQVYLQMSLPYATVRFFKDTLADRHRRKDALLEVTAIRLLLHQCQSLITWFKDRISGLWWLQN